MQHVATPMSRDGEGLLRVHEPIRRLLARSGLEHMLRYADRQFRPGKDVLRGMLAHCAAAGVKATVVNTVADGERAAATITCEFPGGRKVLVNGIFEIESGRIVREHDVLSGDPKSA